jgi:hypothetical protein
LFCHVSLRTAYAAFTPLPSDVGRA